MKTKEQFIGFLEELKKDNLFKGLIITEQTIDGNIQQHYQYVDLNLFIEKIKSNFNNNLLGNYLKTSPMIIILDWETI